LAGVSCILKFVRPSVRLFICLSYVDRARTKLLSRNTNRSSLIFKIVSSNDLKSEKLGNYGGLTADIAHLSSAGLTSRLSARPSICVTNGELTLVRLNFLTHPYQSKRGSAPTPPTRLHNSRTASYFYIRFFHSLK
jgi:hypothetical protein